MYVLDGQDDEYACDGVQDKVYDVIFCYKILNTVLKFEMFATGIMLCKLTLENTNMYLHAFPKNS